jgi:hypothetical protein
MTYGYVILLEGGILEHSHHHHPPRVHEVSRSKMLISYRIFVYIFLNINVIEMDSLICTCGKGDVHRSYVCVLFDFVTSFHVI